MGCTKFSERLLLEILEISSVSVKALFTIPEHFHISYSEELVHNSNYADLKIHAEYHGIPNYEVDSIDGKRMKDRIVVLEEIRPDVILVMGWYYMIPKAARELARLGAWGIHASLLPRYAGGAPLVWAIMNGEERTGVTLFRMSSGVDDGDRIRQRSFDIGSEETIREVYEKATDASVIILREVLSDMENISFLPQRKEDIEVWPQRRPADGQIDLSWPAKRMFDFVRAQAPPYPGAFIQTSDGKKLVILKARIDEN